MIYSEKIFTAKEQQVILNAMSWAEVEEVHVVHRKNEPENLFDMYSDEEYENYVFSIDTDADGDCIVLDRN